MKINWGKIAIAGLKFAIDYILVRKAKKKAQAKYVDKMYKSGNKIHGVIYIVTDSIELFKNIKDTIPSVLDTKVKCYFDSYGGLSEKEISPVFTYEIYNGDYLLVEKTFLSYQEVLVYNVKELIDVLTK